MRPSLLPYSLSDGRRRSHDRMPQHQRTNRVALSRPLRLTTPGASRQAEQEEQGPGLLLVSCTCRCRRAKQPLTNIGEQNSVLAAPASFSPGISTVPGCVLNSTLQIMTDSGPAVLLDANEVQRSHRHVKRCQVCLSAHCIPYLSAYFRLYVMEIVPPAGCTTLIKMLGTVSS